MSIVQTTCATTGKVRRIIIAPHGICDSCGKGSGPEFELDNMIHEPFESVYHRRNIMYVGARRLASYRVMEKITIQVQQLNEEIDRLDTELSGLKFWKERLEEYVFQEISLLAAIRSLPDDVLRHIFLMVWDGCDDYDIEGHVSVTSSAGTGCIRTLTQVCSYWRSLALSFPGLWSRVTFSCSNKMKGSEYESHLKKFITLSKDRPLSLGVSFKPELFNGRLVRTIANSAKRWKEAKILNYAEVFQAILRHIPPNDVFSRLESLVIMLQKGDLTLKATPLLTQLTVDNFHLRPAFKIQLESAPSLSDFTVIGMRDLGRMLVGFPWAQITTFSSINCVFAEDELASLMSSMPNLTTLAYHGETYTSRQLVLRKVHSLTLGATSQLVDIDKNTTPYAIDLLVTPKLTALHCVESRTKNLKLAVSRLLQRSSCYLDELTVFETMIGDGWRWKGLAKLKTLCLIKSRNIGGELRSLTRKRKGKPDVLPLLESLELQDVPFGAKTALRNLLPMIKSRLPPLMADRSRVQRRNNVTYLKSVTIKFERDLRENEKRQLREFMSSKHVRLSGVAVSMAYGDQPSDCLDYTYEEYPSDTDTDTPYVPDDYSTPSDVDLEDDSDGEWSSDDSESD